MSRLKKLIEELCPNGVEFKKLGELGTFYGGLTGKSKDDFKEGNAKYITYMNVYKNIKVDIQILETVKVKENEKQNRVMFGDILFTGSSENMEECGLSSVYTEKNEETVYLNSFSFGFRFNDETIFEPEFTKYLFRSNDLRKQIIRTASGVTRFNVSKKKMENIVVPVPPLEVQREIVHILDDFTLLSALLSAELKARKQQYEYYSSKLIEGNMRKISNVPLGEIAQFTYGYTDKAKDFGDTRFIRITDILDNGTLNKESPKFINLTEESKKYLLKKGDILVARTGATYGKTLYIENDEKMVYASFLIKINLNNEKILNRFYWHFTKTPLYWEQANKLVSGGGQPQFNAGAISRIKIPLPSLEIQEKIVNVLDHFDAICSDLKIGLPAEIEARQKQYEFYRDTLLTYAATGEIIFREEKRREEKRREEKRREEKRSIIRLIQYVFGNVNIRLKDVVGIYLGLTHTPKYVENGIKFISAQNTSNDRLDLENVKYISEEEYESITNNAKPKKNDVLFTRVGSNLGHPVIVETDERLCIFVSLGFFRIIDEDILNNKFLKYWLNTEEFWKQVRKNVHGSAKINLNTGWIREFNIKIPCILKQKEIVNILEKLEKITNDIQDGIPAEIEARKKQYEYYRDKILTFKELS